MLHKSLFILGRQPELGRAELESVFGADALEPLGEHAMACDLPWEEIPFERLGGSIRLAKLLTVLDSADWHDIARNLTKALPGHLAYLPEGKVKLGLSAFGLNIRPQQLIATGLELKKACRKAGRSARVVPNTEPGLSSAQVLHNQLTGELGLELLLVKSGKQIYLAQTKKIQDIAAYARRDQGRPKRDARVGMLPPKLAQIIINLASGSTAPSSDVVVLDPFCGTGVVLQEALLMGYSAYGTDIDQRMVDYSIVNVHEWFYMTNHPELQGKLTVALGDATTKKWEDDIWNEQKKDFDWQPAHIDFLASETYLGRPFSTLPSAEVLTQTIHDVNSILKKFLQNVARQTRPGFRLCIAVPAWQTNRGLRHLPMLDHLDELGYNRVSFEHVGAPELVYARPGQIVTRELLVITRK